MGSLDICEGLRNARQAKKRFGEEHRKLTWIKFNEDSAGPRREIKGLPSPIPKRHAPIGVQGMVIASMLSAASLTTQGHKVVVSGPVNLAKGEKAKAKEKAKEKDEDAEEEREREPL